MDFTARKRKSLKPVAESPISLYPHDLNMYNVPPTGEVMLEEFETLAIERLQLLRIVEEATLKGNKPYSEEWKRSIIENLTKLELRKFVRLLKGLDGQSELDFNARRADHLSHYILRLAYCRSEDLRRWFLNREIEWFKLRFLCQNDQSLSRFFTLNKLVYIPITDVEKSEIFNELLLSTANFSELSVSKTNFYKVPFENVLSLVRSRKVFLKEGFAYIPSGELVVCVQSTFRAKLSEALNIACFRLPSLDDDRINSFLVNLNHAYTGKDYTPSGDDKKIDPADIDNFSKKHFPMCMRFIHEKLRSTHHLKHFARLQYGLFLKAIGLSLEDALQFWRDEFTKVMEHDKFDKEHAYNIKHSFGKTGNMVNYSPYGCLKIIMGSVGAGEHHGCPFKHWDGALIKQKLLDYGVSSEGIQSVMDMVKNGHFQVACTSYFEYTHSQQPPSMMISHPNQYFEESRKLSGGDKKKDK